jgi:mannosyltransferase
MSFRHRKWLIRIVLAVLILAFWEVWTHTKDFEVPRPSEQLDPPFYQSCQEPGLNNGTRANAAIVMLARNSDMHDAAKTVRNMQKKFNNRFTYPWVFLNDEPFSAKFIKVLNTAVAKGASGTKATFETIPKDMWGYPDWIDQNQARRSMRKQERQDIMYGGKESYHHMCRFNSGFFFDHPALRNYKWYWRVEPEVSLSCSVTYDPFIEMERHGKRYGYTVALWELGETAPSLFRKLSEYKKQKNIISSSLWTAMMDPSYAPWPLRSLLGLSWFPNRDSSGDLWNTCHLWSNFEIADLDFYRSQEYRDMFRFLDEDGGFYHERWGDAPVHSLAAGLFLKPEEIHHFSDFGYVHPPFQYCPYDVHAKNSRASKGSAALRSLGCDCSCPKDVDVIGMECFNKLRRAVDPR